MGRKKGSKNKPKDKPETDEVKGEVQKIEAEITA